MLAMLLVFFFASAWFHTGYVLAGPIALWVLAREVVAWAHKRITSVSGPR